MTGQAKTAPSAGRATLLLAGLVSIMPFAIDAYLPALAVMADDLATTVHHLEQSVGSFFLGTALGQLIGAPFSDRYGRKLPVMSGLLIFIMASAAIVLTETAVTLNIWRFVQAVGAGVAVVNAAAIVRDLFDEVETAKLFANIAVVMMIAPLVSPLVGAYLLEHFDWHAIFVFLAAYGLIVALLFFTLMPETRFLRATPIAANGYQHVLASGWSNLLAVSLAFSSGCFFLYLADSSFIFLRFYGLSPTAFAWMFGLGVLMLIAAHRLNHWLLARYKPRRLLMYSLPLQMTAALFVLVYALAGAQSMWLMYALIMLLASITQLIGSNGLAVYLALHPDHTGKANAILGSMRFGMAGVLGFTLSVFHTQTMTSFGILVGLSALASSITFAVCRWGSDIFSRQNTA